MLSPRSTAAAEDAAIQASLEESEAARKMMLAGPPREERPYHMSLRAGFFEHTGAVTLEPKPHEHEYRALRNEW